MCQGKARVRRRSRAAPRSEICAAACAAFGRAGRSTHPRSSAGPWAEPLLRFQPYRALPGEAVANHALFYHDREAAKLTTARHGQRTDAEAKRGGSSPPRTNCFPSPQAAEDRVSAQFGTAAFGFGGKAASLTAPRRRSRAILSALSSFSSGGT